jgi:hypothetical protein
VIRTSGGAGHRLDLVNMVNWPVAGQDLPPSKRWPSATPALASSPMGNGGVEQGRRTLAGELESDRGEGGRRLPRLGRGTHFFLFAESISYSGSSRLGGMRGMVRTRWRSGGGARPPWPGRVGGAATG